MTSPATYRALAAIGLAAITVAAPLGASAATRPPTGSSHTSFPKPVTGAWSLQKKNATGLQRDVTYKVTKGAKSVTAMSLIPTGSCAGKQIKVDGTLPIKLNKKYGYYVGRSYTSTSLVNVTQGGAVSQAGLLVRYTNARLAVVLLNAIGTTGGCEFNYSVHKPKR